MNTSNDKLIKSTDLKSIRQKYNSKKIVFTYGTFDLLHSGHAAYLAEAKNYGDILVVGVSSDKCKKELRGQGFPLVHEKNRSEILDYFEFVDYTIIVDDRDLLKAIKALKPDVFYTITSDWKSHLRKSNEDKFIKSYGGQIVKVKPVEPFISSSDIVERVADLKIKEIVEYFFGKIKIDLSKGDWSQKKFSGIKASVREDSIFFGDNLNRIGLFGRKFHDKIINLKTLDKVLEREKKEGKNVVFTSGSCDLIHSGHARFFAKAKTLGDVLVLALPSDRIIRKQKGRGRPIVSEKSRSELMAFFEFTDYVIIFDTDSVIPLLEKIQPDVFFTVKEDWNDIENSPLSDMIKKWGGRVEICPPQAEGLSSSKLIRKAAGMRVRQIFSEVLKEAEKWTSLKD